MTGVDRRAVVEAELAALVAWLDATALLGAGSRCRALLSDRCSLPDRDCRREIAAVATVSDALGWELTAAQLSAPLVAERLAVAPESAADDADLRWAVGCWRRVLGHDDANDLTATSRRTLLLAIGSVVVVGGAAGAAAVLGADDETPPPAPTTTDPPASTTTNPPEIGQVSFPSTTEGPFLVTRTWSIDDSSFTVSAVVASASGAAVDELHDEVVPSAFAVDPAAVQFDPPAIRAVGTPIVARHRVVLPAGEQVTLVARGDLVAPLERSESAVAEVVERWRSEWQAADPTVRRAVGDPTLS